MKRVIWCVTLLFLLAGCQKPEETVSCIAQAQLTRLEGELAATDGERLAMQENLAMWYNQNLLEENDPDFREAYDTILFYSDGVMGSLEIPGREIHLPIYHGTAGARGIGHDPATAFPIGGTGNHPVLTIREAVSLEEGELFVIHIMGRDLTYQVVAVRDAWDTTPVPGVDYCSLIIGEDTQALAVRQP